MNIPNEYPIKNSVLQTKPTNAIVVLNEYNISFEISTIGCQVYPAQNAPKQTAADSCNASLCPGYFSGVKNTRKPLDNIPPPQQICFDCV
ncbi:MAG: hypothetical protein ACI8RD_008361 [Bacillariaceae sp.]|jgi:hypothetical protein